MSTYDEWLKAMESYTPDPWIATIEDHHGALWVTVDHHDGRGPVLSMSVPSGRLAAHPEARARGYAEALAKAEAHRDALAEWLVRGPRICAHRTVVEPSETAPVLSRCTREAGQRGYCAGHAWMHS